MRLIIFNGSPKIGSNNTQILIDKFTEGFKELNKKNEVETLKLNTLPSVEHAVSIFKEAEAVLLAFPLYTYAMPAGVNAFIEALEPLKGKCAGKKIGFLVQYGFKEAIHARPLEKYLEQLVKILGGEYLGTIIKGGCDALSKLPEKAIKSQVEGIRAIGKALGQTGCFDKRQLDDYSKPEIQKKKSKLFMKIFIRLANKFYWEAAFKKNGVTYEESFRKPYEKQATH